MTVLREGDLEFDFSGALSAFCYDDNKLHGSSGMKRVDFIAEYPDKWFFIEVKDPDNPKCQNRDEYTGRFTSGKILPELAGKYRDTLWFRTLSRKIGKKPVHYIALVALKNLEPAMFQSLQDQLHKALPLKHGDWCMPFAESCLIMNLETYKRIFGPDSVRRISAASS
jgi:hypothetical protein